MEDGSLQRPGLSVSQSCVSATSWLLYNTQSIFNTHASIKRTCLLHLPRVNEVRLFNFFFFFSLHPERQKRKGTSRIIKHMLIVQPAGSPTHLSSQKTNNNQTGPDSSTPSVLCCTTRVFLTSISYSKTQTRPLPPSAAHHKHHHQHTTTTKTMSKRGPLDAYFKRLPQETNKKAKPTAADKVWGRRFRQAWLLAVASPDSTHTSKTHCWACCLSCHICTCML